MAALTVIILAWPLIAFIGWLLTPGICNPRVRLVVRIHDNISNMFHPAPITHTRNNILQNVLSQPPPPMSATTFCEMFSRYPHRTEQNKTGWRQECCRGSGGTVRRSKE